ncbi:hypothetical protein WA158_002079 [Blastocystis sp. Blastoise]
MGRTGQFVVGPAGTGKSSYCKAMKDYCESSNRRTYVINLDPAAEDLAYDCDLDIRDLISLNDALEEMNLGPNGGLVFSDEIAEFDEDGFFIFDCPGQIELFTHFTYMRDIAKKLTDNGFRLCSVYLMDAPFVSDEFKYISGSLMGLTTMLQMELPHVNVLTKCDMVDQEKIDKYIYIYIYIRIILGKLYIFPDGLALATKLSQYFGDSPFANLHTAMADLLDDFSMVAFLEFSIYDEDKIANVLLQTDIIVQYGEDLDVPDTIPGEEQEEPDEPEGEYC